MGTNADIVLKASSQESADGYAAVFDFEDASTYALGWFMLKVSAVEGTLPALDVFVQTQLPDNSYTDMVRFAQMTTTGVRQAIVVRPSTPDAAKEQGTVDRALAGLSVGAGNILHLPMGPRYKVGWKISGTLPKFTFEVLATLHT